MDDTRQFLEDAAAAEEPEVLGHLRAEMSRIRATTSAKETPFGDVGKVPSAAKLLKTKQPDDWLIDQFGMRGSLVVLGGATGASKSTLVYGMAQAISTGGTWGGQLQCKQGKALVIQSDESERNAQRKLQVMDMDPSFDLLTGNFVEALRDRLAVAELGATMLTGLVGDVSIPKRTGMATAYWFGADNADVVSESTGTIGTISMSPKTVGAYSKFSRLMELQSTPDIEQLIRADFVALLADAIDTAAINGSGSSSQPLGILNTSGIGLVAGGTNGLAPTLDHLLDLKK